MPKAKWSSTPRAKRHRKPLTLTLSEEALETLSAAVEDGVLTNPPGSQRNPFAPSSTTFKSQSAVVEWLINTYL